MSSLSDSPRKLDWLDLESGLTLEGWAAIELPVAPGQRSALLAMDPNDGHHLLIPAKEHRYPTNVDSPLSVDVVDHEFSFRDGRVLAGRFIDVYCRLPKLNDLFDDVIDSILEATEGSHHPAQRAITTVNQWRHLFSSFGATRELTVVEKYAAFAELTILDELRRYDDDFSADWWTGPKREPHDFELPFASLEVKAIGSHSHTVTIHGADQLDRSGTKPLFMVLVEIVEDDEGYTVSEFLEFIADKVSDPTRVRMSAATLGVFPNKEDTLRLQVKSMSLAVVGKTFPRIIRSDLNSAVESALMGLEYELSLDHLKPLLTPVGMGDLRNEIDGKC